MPRARADASAIEVEVEHENQSRILPTLLDTSVAGKATPEEPMSKGVPANFYTDEVVNFKFAAATAGTVGQRDLEERHARMQAVDAECLTALTDFFHASDPLATEAQWQSALLVDGEIPLAALRCVAFQDMPCNEDDDNVFAGKGLLLFTRMNGNNGNPGQHRLHCLIFHQVASFDAAEKWSATGCLCCANESMFADYDSQHHLKMKSVSFAVEPNVSSVSTSISDTAHVIAKLGRRVSFPWIVRLVIILQVIVFFLLCILLASEAWPAMLVLLLLDAIFTGLLLLWHHYGCCSLGMSCCQTGTSHWQQRAALEAAMSEEIFIKEEKHSKGEKTCKFPDVEAKTFSESRDLTVKQMRCVTMLCGNSGSRFTAWTSPTETASAVVKFASMLSVPAGNLSGTSKDFSGMFGTSANGFATNARKCRSCRCRCSWWLALRLGLVSTAVVAVIFGLVLLINAA